MVTTTELVWERIDISSWGEQFAAVVLISATTWLTRRICCSEKCLTNTYTNKLWLHKNVAKNILNYLLLNQLWIQCPLTLEVFSLRLVVSMGYMSSMFLGYTAHILSHLSSTGHVPGRAGVLGAGVLLLLCCILHFSRYRAENLANI